MKRIFLLLTILPFVCGCVYDFSADVPEGEAELVVEGDIVAGGVSKFSISQTTPVNSGIRMKEALAIIWVEDSEGGKYGSDKNLVSKAEISVPYHGGREYRLRVRDRRNGVVYDYATPWAKPCEAPTLSNLRVEVGKSEVDVLFDAVPDPGNPYVKWSYTERWEYSADYNAQYLFVYKNPRKPGDREYYTPVTGGTSPTFYCWNSGEGIDGVKTAEDGGKVSGAKIAGISRKSKKVQILYNVGLNVCSIPQEAYEYFNEVNMASSITGDLFAPTPNAIYGNIRDMKDGRTALVGYVCVLHGVSTVSKFFYNSELGMYAGDVPDDTKLLLDPEDHLDEDETLDQFYMRGNRPVRYDVSNIMLWSERRCVDCTAETGGGKYAGTKDKPSDWPTEHK